MTLKRRVKNKFRWIKITDLPLLFGLVITWMMLWQEVSLMSVTSGIVVAEAVVGLFYLPPIGLAGRFNPFWAALYLGYFLWNLVLGALEVAWAAVRPDKQPTPAIIAVQLKSRSDFILTMTGLTISLIPGSLIVDIDRFESVIYLHALNAKTLQRQHRLKREVHKIERLLVNTIGSAQDLRSLR